ncbi:hypothetical protein M0812_03202 [Anaeramoeba flamelloides]|uniref:Uncharacterized protein n=1 Tax=Anaeramoeba flamelloides TaxID=1746091 RepID=A0AAV8AFD7_9EUKA|nr:hypothetical protein M0812_03202 [Anaeramoeba flamelloides]
MTTLFGIGGFETDFSESGLPIDDNIEDISSNSESEMEEFPYQIVPKNLDCEVFSDYDEDSDYYEDLSNTNTTNSTTKKTNHSTKYSSNISKKKTQ